MESNEVASTDVVSQDLFSEEIAQGATPPVDTLHFAKIMKPRNALLLSPPVKKATRRRNREANGGKKAKLDTVEYHVGNWLSTGSKAIIDVVKNHLVAEPLFSSRKIVLVLHAIGEAAIMELIEKFPTLDVTMPVELPSPESSETSGLGSGFASSRKVEMHDLEDGESEFGYLQSDMQSKTWNEKMYLSAALFGDYINNSESDSGEVLEEGRAERDYFTLISNDFISPSVIRLIIIGVLTNSYLNGEHFLKSHFERRALGCVWKAGNLFHHLRYE